MTTPNDKPWNREEFVARQLAIVAKYTKVQLKPKPTPQEKAREAWKPSIEKVLESNRQSNQRALERAEQEQAEAQRQRQREEFTRRAQIANETAVDLSTTAMGCVSGTSLRPNRHLGQAQLQTAP